jgi:C1A family cysteine protease
MAKKRPRRRPVNDNHVADLQLEIDKKAATWKAGRNALTDATKDERRSRLGLSPTKGELEALKALIEAANSFASLHSAVSLPTAIDWRSNGGNFVTPIKDQSSCGSCVAFGTIATIESRANIVCKSPGTSRDYSEAFLFYCGCGACCAAGWNFMPALEFCKARGVAVETAFPYTPGNQPCKTGVSPAFRIDSYFPATSLIERKSAIASRGPVIAGMAVYDDFFAYSSGVYRHVAGSLAGYHAVSVVGYNDSLGCWICKNSWGASWGDSGFFKIAYGECGIDSQFLFYEPVVPCT